MYILDSSTGIRNCRFSGNIVTQSCAMGGGIYNRESSPSLSNCIFLVNAVSGTSWAKGGAMYNQSSSPSITNCTFSLNRAESTSGNSKAAGIYNDSSSFPIIVNTILWDNTATYYKEIYDTSCNITFSNVDQSPFEKDSARGNLRADPLFVDPDNGDLGLQEGSPCIDAGYSSTATLPDTDFHGFQRIVGSSPDMGAMEWRGQLMDF